MDDDSDVRWFVIRRLARHVFFCWPRRWSYDYQGRGPHDLCSYRRTCLRCGLSHRARRLTAYRATNHRSPAEMADMKKRFEDALGDLLAEYAEEDAEVLISAMELQIMALKEEHHEDER